ncbi:MAG: histidinol-phosphatase [Oscillospiraceae bacterium]|nr:histidinol-phosphatase [Oscillospiraceae bacterium]
MYLQNLHTHTVFGDGKDTVEGMVQGALRSGCVSLGFSEHSHLPAAADPDGYTMRPEETPVYRDEVLQMQEKYAGKLEIFLGLEQDIDSILPQNSYDYLIGSVHGVWKDGIYLPVDESRDVFAGVTEEHYNGDFLAFAQDYYRREAEVCGRTKCQIAGHFDLVTKFNEGGCFFDESDARYRNAALEALEVLLQQDLIFEVNTGAMSRGYRTVPYPAPMFLKFICEKNGRICITSDSHSADTIIHAFDQARELARSCGFRETAVLTKTGFQMQAL